MKMDNGPSPRTKHIVDGVEERYCFHVQLFLDSIGN